MGLSGPTASLIGLLGGPMLQGLFGNNGQQRQSFEGKGDADPTSIIRKNQAMLDSIMPLILRRANAGV